VRHGWWRLQRRRLVVDAAHHRSGAMSALVGLASLAGLVADAAGTADAVAAIAGCATLVLVLLLGAAGRAGPPSRWPASPNDEAPPPDADGAAGRPTTDRVHRLALPGAAIIGLLVAAWATGPIGSLAVAAVVLGGVSRGRARARLASRRRAEEALPDAIELLVLCVHAGRSPTQGVLELAQRAPPAVRPGFAAVGRQLRRGHGLADALAELPRVLGPGARELATTVAIADREGLPLTPMLDRLAADARAARRRLGEAATKQLPVRLAFPLVTCVLPAFVLLALAPAVLGALSSLRGFGP
jgi:Type II secretion system (T2SS), protein F